MPALTQNTILENIRRISQGAKGENICSTLLEALETETAQVAQYLGSSNEEAFFFAVVLSLYFNGREVEFNDLCRFFDSDSFEILPHLVHLDGFVQNGILIRKGPSKRMSDIPFFKSYAVASEVCDAIVKNKPCPVLKKKYQGTLIDALEMMHDQIVSCLDDELSAEELFTELEALAKQHKKYQIFKTIHALGLSPIDLAVLIYVTWLTIIGSKRVDADRVLKTIIKRNADRAKYLQDIYYLQNPLIKNGLLETKEARFFNDVDYLISDKTKTLLEEDGIIMPHKSSKRTDVILPENIAEKPLFYNEKELVQIDKMRASLDHTAYTDIAERLKAKNLSTGITILLFGDPGTGKTELVLQMAKQTGRQIMKIDISKTKSMWFGESEKLVKKIFDDYKAYAQTQEKTPILFFNEADAVLSKRTSSDKSNTSNTENAIQNLLLDEFENFDGILIATTNLTKNLDPAYDRRFLFKIKIGAPDQLQRQTIWQSKLKFLSEQDCISLAELSLTGGQIDNIARKCEIQQILNGKYPSLQEIEEYCLEELALSAKVNRTIGF
jgi:SpoVK/Ycf46/Vps4 family AAA+-type ATPase